MGKLKYEESAGVWKSMSPSQKEFDDFKDSATAQLAETAKKTKFKKPLFVESFATFGRYGVGTPEGIANYPSGNYVLNITGNAGDSFVSVTGGNIAHAGTTKKWAAVIKDDNGNYFLCQARGTDGVSKVNIYPSLDRNISNGILSNLHDAVAGQHYSEHGYKAFGQHIYNFNPDYAQRNNYIDRFISNDTTSKWVAIGGLNASSFWYARGLSPSDPTDLLLTGDNPGTLSFDTTAIGQGVEWEVALDKKLGYVECNLGIYQGGKIEVSFYADDKLQEIQVVERELERVIFKFNLAKKGKIQLKALEVTTTTWKIGRTIWWAGEETDSLLIPTTANKVVYLGDSWGTYHSQANPREIERLMKFKNPSAVLSNHSAGGMTTKWGVAWFKDYVINEKPDVVIIEFFTNDINCINGASSGMNFTDPSGTTQSTYVNEQDYYYNLDYMCRMALENDITPIVIMPSTVESQNQTQYHATYATKMANGVPANASTIDISKGNITHLTTDLIETKTSVNTFLELLTSSYGVRIKPRVMLYGGSLFTVANNNGNVLFKVGFDSTNEGGLGTLNTLELTGVYAEQGMLLPNSHVVDNANVFKIKERANKTLNRIELGEGVSEGVELKSALKVFDAGTLPTADSTNRGKIIRISGGTGVADKIYMCIKDATESYVWKEL